MSAAPKWAGPREATEEQDSELCLGPLWAQLLCSLPGLWVASVPHTRRQACARTTAGHQWRDTDQAALCFERPALARSPTPRPSSGQPTLYISRTPRGTSHRPTLKEALDGNGASPRGHFLDPGRAWVSRPLCSPLKMQRVPGACSRLWEASHRGTLSRLGTPVPWTCAPFLTQCRRGAWGQRAGGGVQPALRAQRSNPCLQAQLHRQPHPLPTQARALLQSEVSPPPLGDTQVISS